MKRILFVLLAIISISFTYLNCTAKADSSVAPCGNNNTSKRLSSDEGEAWDGRHVTYTKADSALVVKLLEEGSRQGADANLMVFFGKKFLGLPYVAATLEVNPTERLVVNLHGLDCTTYVETVLALTLATREGGRTFGDFCCQLQRIRYQLGRLEGYPSRNHYFSQWIQSNSEQGIVEEVTSKGAPFTASHTIDIHYMSQHPDKYPMLKDNTRDQAVIRANEEKVNGTVVRYIPKSKVGGNRQALSMIHDGDIIALVTTKDGLDVSHLGLAVWGKDGKLHLMNASMIYHKVVLDKNTLYDYQQRQKSQTGIRVIRVL